MKKFNTDDEKYRDVIESLKKLTRINPPENFDVELKKRLTSRQLKADRNYGIGFLTEERLVPSAALIAAAVLSIAVFLFERQNFLFDDPLLQEPKLRQDIVSLDQNYLVDSKVQYQFNEKTDTESFYNQGGGKLKGEPKKQPQVRIESDSQSNFPSNLILTAELVLQHEGLNFRPVSKDFTERQKLEQLRSKLNLLKVP